MWKILAAVVCTMMAEGAYAADIARLQACKISDIKAAVVERDKGAAKIARAGPETSRQAVQKTLKLVPGPWPVVGEPYSLGPRTCSRLGLITSEP